MNNNLTYKFIKPGKSLSDFVESFWLLQNDSDSDKEVIVLPDGRIDLIFSKSATKPLTVTFLGIGTHPDKGTLTAKTRMVAISFKLPATEYVFHHTVAHLLNKAENLPTGFWNFSANDLDDFEAFCRKASQKIQALLSKETDSRKRKLFDLIYASNGSLTVKELSEKVFWSSRQVNRYFNQQYGLSLKAYCNILRFRASFPHIKQGKLFPEENFADQSHFIKEVKKLSGVLPKDLSKNEAGRFVQFSFLGNK